MCWFVLLVLYCFLYLTSSHSINPLSTSTLSPRSENMALSLPLKSSISHSKLGSGYSNNFLTNTPVTRLVLYSSVWVCQTAHVIVTLWLTSTDITDPLVAYNWNQNKMWISYFDLKEQNNLSHRLLLDLRFQHFPFCPSVSATLLW